MLARLQTAIALSLLALAAAWLVFTLPGGRWLAAALGLLLLGGGHALVLGLECLLVARVNRHDPAPAASVVQWLRAWLGECLSAPRVFLWQQPFRSRRWPDQLPAHAQGRRGLLLVHGFVCNRGIWNRWLQRLTAQGVPFVAVDLEPVPARSTTTAPASTTPWRGCGPAPAWRRWWWRTAWAGWRCAAGVPGPGARRARHHVITLGTPAPRHLAGTLGFRPQCRADAAARALAGRAGRRRSGARADG